MQLIKACNLEVDFIYGEHSSRVCGVTLRRESVQGINDVCSHPPFISIVVVCKEIQIILRLFLVITMYCQASSINH